MEKQKPILHEFDLSIYPRKLWIAMSKSTFPDLLNDVTEFADDTGARVDVVENKNNKAGVLIRFRNKNAINYNYVCHESIHAALSIFHDIGATIDYDNPEPFTYLAGYIAKCCEEVKKHNAK